MSLIHLTDIKCLIKVQGSEVEIVSLLQAYHIHGIDELAALSRKNSELS